MPFLAEGKFPAHYTLSGDVACRYTFYYSNSSQLRCVHALKELTKSQPTIMTWFHGQSGLLCLVDHLFAQYNRVKRRFRWIRITVLWRRRLWLMHCTTKRTRGVFIHWVEVSNPTRSQNWSFRGRPSPPRYSGGGDNGPVEKRQLLKDPAAHDRNRRPQLNRSFCSGDATIV